MISPAKDGSDIAMDWLSHPSTILDKVSSYPPHTKESQALYWLCQRSYWRRIWIIQELSLSADYVVYCGSKSIPMITFDQRLFLARSEHPELRSTPASHHVMARRTMHQGNRMSRWIRPCTEPDHGFECSREHDSIYALLDISSDYKSGSNDIEVYYRKSPRNLFIEVVQKGFLYSPTGYRNPKTFERLAGKMKVDVDEGLRALINAAP